jgi:hypothetical protein
MIQASPAPFALLSRALADDLPVHQSQHGRSARVRAEVDLRRFRTLLAGLPVSFVRWAEVPP